LGDLKSRRAVIAFGVGLWSAFTALGATVSRFWQLLVCRSLVGVGEAGYGPAAQALLAEFFRGKRRAFALGIYSVGMAFGGVLGIWRGALRRARSVRGTAARPRYRDVRRLREHRHRVDGVPARAGGGPRHERSDRSRRHGLRRFPPSRRDRAPHTDADLDVRGRGAR